MNKIFLVLKREYLSRVKKKSFLLTTILTPLIIPLLLLAIFYFSEQERQSADSEVVMVLDESQKFGFRDSKSYDFLYLENDIESAKKAFQESDHKALLHIPEIDLDDPRGFVLYSKDNLSLNMVDDINDRIDARIEKLRLEKTGIDSATIAGLNANVTLRSINLSETGEEQVSSAGVTFGIAYFTGFMIYLLIFIYGAQIMQGVLEEKTSRVVEILISSIRPFHLLMGKVLGIASVAFTQLLIWVVLISILSTAVLSSFGLTSPSEAAIENVASQVDNAEVAAAMASDQSQEIMAVISSIPFGMLAFTFIFYFIGGYLLYGAMFAAVGAAVDNPSDAQQFMFPITIPIIISFIGLSLFILMDPDSSASFWFSVIPFTSPIAMMGRVAFGVPLWELILSMVLLIAGFVFTIWVAGRIYRIGILLHGTKVNYKVLAKWAMMKN